MADHAVADEGDPHRVEPVKRPEFAVRLPPGVGHGGEAGDLVGGRGSAPLRSCLAVGRAGHRFLPGRPPVGGESMDRRPPHRNRLGANSRMQLPKPSHGDAVAVWEAGTTLRED